MKIQIFKNYKGLIHGSDQKRIGCSKEGVLKIGNTEVSIAPETDSIMPLLFNGCTGRYSATFTDKEGNEYNLGSVEVQGGRITPPPPTAVEFMELRCHIEAIEKMCETMREQIHELSNIFDTNSLNFLI